MKVQQYVAVLPLHFNAKFWAFEHLNTCLLSGEPYPFEDTAGVMFNFWKFAILPTSTHLRMKLCQTLKSKQFNPFCVNFN